MIGRTLSHYRITEKLGEGGMGVVYLAEDIVLGRQVAIKTLTAERTGDNQHFRTRFLREARAVSTLSHPHIATIYDYGEDESGEPYIVMELIKGRTLGDLMLKEKLTIPRAIEIIKQVGEALSEAHHHGIIHRDIKPSNVAINDRGNVKVLDFGLAKQLDLRAVQTTDSDRQTLLNTQTREGVIVGTPMYLSPEQALGVEVDARSDIFSLGALLYECVAGKPPFFGKSPMEICTRVIRDDPAPPSQLNKDVPPGIDQISLKALAKKPEQRYQTADEMIAALSAAQTTLEGRNSDRTVTRLIAPPAGTHPTGALATLSDIFKRPRLSIGYVAAALLIFGVLIFAIYKLTRPTLPPPLPEAQQLYDKGVAALQEGSYFKASKLLERAVAADDKFALAHARLAEGYTELDYTDKAKDQMLSATRIVTNRSMLDTTSAYYFDAILATVNRDSPGAINGYTEITRLKPNDAAAFLDLGRAFEAHDEIDKAITQYARASELDRNNPAPWVRSAVLHGRLQDLGKANAEFAKAEQLYQDDQNFEGSSEVFFQRGYLFAQMSKIPEAQQAAEKSLNLATTADNKYQQVRALLLLATIAYSSGNTEQAQTLITRGLELARANSMENLTTQGLLDLSNALLLKRSFAEAERYARQAYDLAQSYREKRNEARANLLLGSIYIQQEKADQGKPFVDQALNFYGTGGYRREKSRCMVMIGRVQLLKGDFDGAVKTLDEQLQLAKQVEDPGQLARSQAEVAAALSKQDLYPQALIRYTESYKLNKQLSNPLNTAFALLNRGDMLARLGRYDETNDALKELQPILDQLSNDNRYKLIWSAWSYLIRAQMDLSEGHFPEAKSNCQQALEVLKHGREVLGDPKAAINTEIAVKGTMGLAKVFTGEVKNGLTLCKDAVALVTSLGQQSTDDADVRLILAEALLESGDGTSALAAAQEAQVGLAARHRQESEWRAWLIAARASERLGHSDVRINQLANARADLDLLQRTWDQESFRSYSARSDIQKYLQYLTRG
jgi:serine/threonine protein kinase/Tfp pilus assembly protein PilF